MLPMAGLTVHVTASLEVPVSVGMNCSVCAGLKLAFDGLNEILAGELLPAAALRPITDSPPHPSIRQVRTAPMLDISMNFTLKAEERRDNTKTLLTLTTNGPHL
jgi:hypothetical protein